MLLRNVRPVNCNAQALLHKLDLFEINDKLFDENEETLF